MKCVASDEHGYQCREDAYYILIYGCFEEHIRETAMCAEHAGYWLKRLENKKWSCNYCPDKAKIEEAYLCLATEMKVEWLNI